MTSKVIQTKTGNQILYKIIKDGYKTITQTIDVVDSLPTRNVYNLESSSVIHNPELNYTVDTSHEYPPVITFNENIITPDDTEITTNKYIFAPYGQDYSVVDDQQEDNFTRVGNVKISEDGVASNFSSTNYLQLQDNENIKELILKVKTNNNFDTSGYKTITEGNLYIGQYSNTFCFWNPVTSSMVTFYSNVQPDTYYWIKAKIENSSLIMSYSTDGENFTQGWSGNANKTGVYFSMIGYSPYNTYFLGDIYLQDFKFFDSNQNEIWKLTWNKLPNNYRVGGSVYVNNNIASNLATWLAPAFTPTTDTWEFTTKIYTGSELTSRHNQILHNSTQNYAMAITRQGISGTPMSSYINSAWTNGITSLSANTWYWFRFSCINKVCRLYITRFDNQSQCPSASNMTLQCTVTANASFIGNVIVLSIDSSEYWGGQIDLKQTQFIEGNRIWKYKDTYSNNASTYTYGTPNFYEGKMWGFSASCYVNLPQSWRSANNWEMVIKTKFNNFNTYSDILHTEHLEALEITTTGIVQSYNWQQGVMEQIFQAEINKDYWVKCIINGTIRTWFVSEDGINYQQKLVQVDTGINSSANYPIRFGASSLNAGNPFVVGEFDLAECYLKINNELIWKGSERVGDFLPGILDSSYLDTGDQVTLNLYDVETNNRTLILNNNRDVTVQNKQYVEYNGEIEIPEHGLSVYDSETYSWSKYRIITLNVNDEDTGIYTEGNI